MKEKINVFFKTNLKVIVIILIAFLLGVGGAQGIRSVITRKNVSTNLGFENIGELATQSAFCTVVSSVDDVRKFYGGLNIPFTESKFIFSYNVQLKAGYDFSVIEWKIDDKKIVISLPKVKILSSELLSDSLEIYYQKESIS